MSTFVDLDSIWRDREYPQSINPFSYILKPEDVQTWFTTARQVRAYPQNRNTVPLEFATSVRIKYLTIPYTEKLASIPRVYVNFRPDSFKDIHLIQAMQGKHKEAKFICQFSHIQYDHEGTPIWIHFVCAMEQVMRFNRQDTYLFEITTRDGQVPTNPDNLPPDNPEPLAQTLCTFEIIPYLRDGDYDHHLLETQTTH